jgi:hypothetical protein
VVEVAMPFISIDAWTCPGLPDWISLTNEVSKASPAFNVTVVPTLRLSLPGVGSEVPPKIVAVTE